MPVETKPAIKSSILWTVAALSVPYIGEVLTYLGQLPAGTLPTPVSLVISGLGGLFIVYKRFYGENKPIEGLFIQRKSDGAGS